MAKYATGKHARAISDRSGLEFPYREMVREWNGSFVHVSEFEPKQPQLEPKPNAGDGVALRNVRTDRSEPPTAVLLPNNPFTITNGSSTLTVSLLNHTLKVGDFVLFYNPASNNPIESFNLGSNLFPIFAVSNAITTPCGLSSLQFSKRAFKNPKVTLVGIPSLVARPPSPPLLNA